MSHAGHATATVVSARPHGAVADPRAHLYAARVDSRLPPQLATRSVRSLAWVGDAIFELHVRTQVALRGDFPVDRLDAIKAAVVRAERQAELLAQILEQLDEAEAAVVRRARNTAPPSSARGRRSMLEYRAASALEALVAVWWTSAQGIARMDALLGPPIAAAIDEAIAAVGKRPKRG